MAIMLNNLSTDTNKNRRESQVLGCYGDYLASVMIVASQKKGEVSSVCVSNACMYTMWYMYFKWVLMHKCTLATYVTVWERIK